MYKVEFIFNQNASDGILNYQAMGKRDDSINNESGFIFECEISPNVNGGVILIEKNGSLYIYNIADFYRVKITEVEG